MHRLTIDRSLATSRHWRLIRSIRLRLVEPEDFKQKWGVTSEGLAKLLDLTTTHVSRWFFTPTATNYRPVEDRHKRRLAEIDYIWSTIEQHESGLAEAPDRLREDYKELRKKR